MSIFRRPEPPRHAARSRDQGPVAAVLAALAAPLLPVAILAASVASPHLHVDVGVIVEKHLTIVPIPTAEVLKEAADVWAPYGVIVAETTSRADPAATHDAVLWVDFSDRPISAAADDYAWEMRLAGIRFSRQGTPSNHIVVYYAGAVRLAIMLGRRDQLERRIAGRALAHEIGHYLLRTPGHAQEGLMLGIHRAADLANVDRSGFMLSAGDLNRLRALWLRNGGSE